MKISIWWIAVILIVLFALFQQCEQEPKNSNKN